MVQLPSWRTFLTIVKKHWKTYIQYVIALFFIFFAFRFFSQQQYEWRDIGTVLGKASVNWVVLGLLLTLSYVFLQAVMYWYSFATIGKTASLYGCLLLFLKRNFVSVFLPAGGITSLVLFNQDVATKDIKKPHVQAASTIYALIGILSVIIVAIPALCFSFTSNLSEPKSWIALLVLVIFFIVLCIVYSDFRKQGKCYHFLTRHFSSFEQFIQLLGHNNLQKKSLYFTIFVSIVIDAIGIGQLYCAMYALGLEPTLFLATMSYIVAVLLLIVSPFLRGIGAIDASVVYMLQKAGYPSYQALAATALFRFFEFWMPLLLGVIGFIVKINRFLVRIIPSVFLCILGLVDISSALTPPIHERLILVHEFFSMKTIHTSNYFVLMAGLFLIMNAFLLLRGARSAFLIGISLCCISIIGNLLKSFDYEEALTAVVVLLILLSTAKEYKVRPKWNISFKTGQIVLFSLSIIFVYGILGLYYFDYQFWHLHLGFGEILKVLGANILMLRNRPIWMTNHITRNFFYSINIWSFALISYLLYVLLRPKYFLSKKDNSADLELAKDMLYKMRQSANDYFKIWSDKQIYFFTKCSGFVSFKTYKNYAVALEGPVLVENKYLAQAIQEFDDYCAAQHLSCFYYRVSENAISFYQNVKKKKLLIGQEAILNVQNFSLSGKNKKSLRNAVNHAQAMGLHVVANQPPIKDGLLQRLESVSDDWLESNKRKEILFSQGAFDWIELKKQTIFTVENEEGMVLAFLNMIPDFGRKESTYDLIRYVQDAPNGIVDFLLTQYFSYLKDNGYENVDIGFAPFSGLDEIDDKNFWEHSMEFTHEKVKPVASYQQGLQRSKDKFGPDWDNRYLVYDEDFDLIQFPLIYNKIVRSL